MMIALMIFSFILIKPVFAQHSDSEQSIYDNVRLNNLTSRAKKKKKKEHGLPDGELINSCSNGINKVSAGVLYKPSADSTDSRRGKPVVLLQGKNKIKTKALNIFNAAGNAICVFTFKAPNVAGTNGNSDHYWSGWSGGCRKTAKQIANIAKSSAGSSNIFIQAKSGKCFGPVKPTSRTGGIR